MYASRDRIGTVVPFSIAGRKSTTVVLEYQGRRSAPVTLDVVPAAPAIFTLDGSGKGQSAVLNQTGCCNSVRNPALQGSIVSLYATGEGKLTPATAPADLAVTVGGKPARIVFTQSDGSLQVDFRIPDDAPVGDAVPLTLSVRGKQSPPGVTIAIRSPRRRILVAHQNESIQRRIAAILESAGHQIIRHKESSEPAFRPPEKVDLLILDSLTPAPRALALINAVKTTSPQLRTLAIAPSLDPDILRDVDLLGAQSVLVEPINAALLTARARTLLRKRPAVY